MLAPAIRAGRGLASESGAVIVSLSGDARNVGLREGDLILQINRVRVTTARAAAQVLQQLAGGTVLMYVERKRPRERRAAQHRGMNGERRFGR